MDSIDSSMIKAMLDSQERAYKSAMDILVKQMTERIDKLEGKVSDLTASLQFTQHEVDELKSTNKEHEREKKEAMSKMASLVDQLNISNERFKELEGRINYQEDYSRRKNLRISGIEERSGGETWEQTAATVGSLLEEKLQMPGLQLERAHRVGIRQDSRPRTIVARFNRFCDREAVMRNAKKLRGTNIFLNDDLCAASQAIKNSQLPSLKEAKAQGKIAYFRHTRLIIKERNAEDGVADRGQRPPVEAAAKNGSGTNSRAELAAVAGAVGGGQASAGPGGAAAGDVVAVEAHGAWTSTPRLDGSRGRSPDVSGPSSQLRTLRKDRKNSKK